MKNTSCAPHDTRHFVNERPVNTTTKPRGPEGGSGAHAVRTWCAEYLQQVALVAIRRLCSSTLAPRRLSATNSVHVASSIIRSPQAISQRLSKPEHMSMITEISTRSSGTGRLGPWPASSNETAWSPDPRQLAARVRRTPPALLPSAARGCGRHALHACPRIAGEGGGWNGSRAEGPLPRGGPTHRRRRRKAGRALRASSSATRAAPGR